MSRRRAREYALQILFQLDLTGNALNQIILDDFWEGSKERDEVRDFTVALVRGTIEHITALDDRIRETAENWQIARMAIIDRSILRIAAYELIHRPDIPPSVSINEAIEIAKKYSTEESASFINGVLDKISRRERAEE